jgi:hypothetical protein
MTHSRNNVTSGVVIAAFAQTPPPFAALNPFLSGLLGHAQARTHGPASKSFDKGLARAAISCGRGRGFGVLGSKKVLNKSRKTSPPHVNLPTQ